MDEALDPSKLTVAPPLPLPLFSDRPDLLSTCAIPDADTPLSTDDQPVALIVAVKFGTPELCRDR